MSGRTKIYSDDELNKKLNDYIQNHKNETITYPSLEKESGIPQHIWKYRMADTVRTYNKNVRANIPEPSDRMVVPSADDVLAMYGDKPELLRTYIQHLLDMVADVDKYKNSERTIIDLEAEYQGKIEELTAKNKQQVKLVEELNRKINMMMLDSQYPNKGYKTNVLEFSRKNEKRFKKFLEDFDL